MAIDVKNTRWAVCKRSDKSILRRRIIWPVADGGPIEGKDPEYELLLHVDEEKPDYDPKTQKLEDSEKVDLRSKTLTKSWTVVDLTPEEILEFTPPSFETSGGIKLDVDGESQNAFTRMLTMINLTEMSDSTEITVKDVWGDSHIITVAIFKQEMKDYAAHCYSLFLSE